MAYGRHRRSLIQELLDQSREPRGVLDLRPVATATEHVQL